MLDTKTISSKDQGALSLTLDTCPGFALPQLLEGGFTTRQSASSGGFTLSNLPFRFKQLVVGMSDNEGFATTSFSTGLLNVMLSSRGQELLSVLSSGSTTKVAVGATELKASVPGAHWSKVLQPRQVSTALSTGAYYETYQDVLLRIRAIINAARQEISSSDGPLIGPASVQDFRGDLATQCFALYLNGTAREVFQICTELLAVAASQAINAYVINDDRTVTVSWSEVFVSSLPASLTLGQKQAVARLLIESARRAQDEWSQPINGAYVGAVKHDTLYGIITSGEELVFNSPVGADDVACSSAFLQSVLHVEEGPDWSSPDALELSQGSSIPMAVDPASIPTPVTEFKDCAALEGNANVLAIAIALGIASQIKQRSLLEQGFAALTWSDKKLSGSFKTSKVTPKLKNPTLAKQAVREVPMVDKDELKKRIRDRADAAGRLIYSALAPGLREVVLPTDGKGRKYLILYSITDDSLRSALASALFEISSLAEYPSTVSVDNFFAQICGPSLSFPIVIPLGTEGPLPADDLHGCLSTLEAVQLRGIRGTAIATAKMAAVEWTHCVEKYKKMAVDSEGEGGAEGTKSVGAGWLALLAIPLVGVLLVALAVNKKPASSTPTAPGSVTPVAKSDGAATEVVEISNSQGGPVTAI